MIDKFFESNDEVAATNYSSLDNLINVISSITDVFSELKGLFSKNSKRKRR